MLVVFFIKVTCPAPAGGGCFADTVATPIFMPVVFMHRMFDTTYGSLWVELLFLVVYWSLVGMLIGFCFDLYRNKSPQN